MNEKQKEQREKINFITDRETKMMILRMCKTCKFYDENCTKKRTVRECAVKGLKNKE